MKKNIANNILRKNISGKNYYREKISKKILEIFLKILEISQKNLEIFKNFLEISKKITKNEGVGVIWLKSENYPG